MKLIILSSLVILLLSCRPFNSEYSFKIKPLLMNLDGINTEYDDYNSDGPPNFSFSQDIIYSTNFKSKGNNFDIFKGNVKFEIEKVKSKCNITSIRQDEFTELNSPSDNELGPMMIYDTNNHDSLYLYASDRTEDISDTVKDLNIYIYNPKTKETRKFGGNTPGFDEAYPEALIRLIIA